MVRVVQVVVVVEHFWNLNWLDHCLARAGVALESQEKIVGPQHEQRRRRPAVAAANWRGLLQVEAHLASDCFDTDSWKGLDSHHVTHRRQGIRGLLDTPFFVVVASC